MSRPAAREGPGGRGDGGIKVDEEMIGSLLKLMQTQRSSLSMSELVQTLATLKGEESSASSSSASAPASAPAPTSTRTPQRPAPIADTPDYSFRSPSNMFMPRKSAQPTDPYAYRPHKAVFESPGSVGSPAARARPSTTEAGGTAREGGGATEGGRQLSRSSSSKGASGATSATSGVGGVGGRALSALQRAASSSLNTADFSSAATTTSTASTAPAPVSGLAALGAGLSPPVPASTAASAGGASDPPVSLYWGAELGTGTYTHPRSQGQGSRSERSRAAGGTRSTADAGASTAGRTGEEPSQLPSDRPSSGSRAAPSPSNDKDTDGSSGAGVGGGGDGGRRGRRAAAERTQGTEGAQAHKTLNTQGTETQGGSFDVHNRDSRGKGGRTRSSRGAGNSGDGRGGDGYSLGATDILHTFDAGDKDRTGARSGGVIGSGDGSSSNSAGGPHVEAPPIFTVYSLGDGDILQSLHELTSRSSSPPSSSSESAIDSGFPQGVPLHSPRSPHSAQSLRSTQSRQTPQSPPLQQGQLSDLQRPDRSGGRGGEGTGEVGQGREQGRERVSVPGMVPAQHEAAGALLSDSDDSTDNTDDGGSAVERLSGKGTATRAGTGTGAGGGAETGALRERRSGDGAGVEATVGEGAADGEAGAVGGRGGADLRSRRGNRSSYRSTAADEAGTGAGAASGAAASASASAYWGDMPSAQPRQPQTKQSPPKVPTALSSPSSVPLPTPAPVFGRAGSPASSGDTGDTGDAGDPPELHFPGDLLSDSGSGSGSDSDSSSDLDSASSDGEDGDGEGVEGGDSRESAEGVDRYFQTEAAGDTGAEAGAEDTTAGAEAGTEKGVEASSAAGLAQLYSRQGRDFYASGSYQRALAAYAKCLALAPPTWPERATALGCRAAVLVMLRRYVEAVNDCEAALRLDPLLIKLHVRRGRALLRLGHFAPAEAAFAVVLGADFRDLLSTEQLFDPEKAAECQRALEGCRGNAALGMRDLGRLRESVTALILLEAGKGEEGTRGEGTGAVGAGQGAGQGGQGEGGGRPREVLRVSTEVLKQAPYYRGALLAKAQALCELGQFEKAKQFAEELTIGAHPSIQTFFAHASAALPCPALGLLEWRTAGTSNSSNSSNSARNSASTQERTLRVDLPSLCLFLLAAGADLAPLYLRALKNTPLGRTHSAQVMAQLATLLRSLATRLSPTDCEGAWAWVGAEALLLGRLLRCKAGGDRLFRAGSLGPAVEAYSEALEVDPSCAQWCAVLLSNRAAALLGLGRHSEAVEDCSQALRRDPGFGKALLRRARAHRALQAHAESRRDFEAYMGTRPAPLDCAQVAQELRDMLQAQSRQHQHREQQPRPPHNASTSTSAPASAPAPASTSGSAYVHFAAGAGGGSRAGTGLGPTGAGMGGDVGADGSGASRYTHRYEREKENDKGRSGSRGGSGGGGAGPGDFYHRFGRFQYNHPQPQQNQQKQQSDSGHRGSDSAQGQEQGQGQGYWWQQAQAQARAQAHAQYHAETGAGAGAGGFSGAQPGKSSHQSGQGQGRSGYGGGSSRGRSRLDSDEDEEGPGAGAGRSRGSGGTEGGPGPGRSDGPGPSPTEACHYAALGVSASSSQRDIKAAYRCLALRFHPDKNREPTAEERFKRIGAAYAVLSDQAARRQYDLTRPSGGGHGGGFSSRYRK